MNELPAAGEQAVEAVADSLRQSSDLTPKEIVRELDRYIVGQRAAKKAVAIALRNRTRRQRLPASMREDVLPKNIILIGPTGVGKTEVARRLARLTQSPFLKVEASKYTEVGYVGRDVESMIRDLTDASVKLVREEKMRENEPRAREAAEERLLQVLLPGKAAGASPPGEAASEEGRDHTRDKLLRLLREGKLDDRMVEIEIQDRPASAMQVFTPGGMEEMSFNIKDLMPNLFGGRSRPRRVSVAQARVLLLRDEAQKMVDMEAVAQAAIERVEQDGMVFIDELDKIAGREGTGRGPDVSREGVQRDLLPIVEGTTVSTKYGMVRTDHILFIGAGAFHVAKPSDLIPELQGRFPIRVELEPLGREDFIRILKEPQNALLKQYTALMATEGVVLEFEDAAVERLADYAVQANEQAENIGARRLHTVMEHLLEEVAFEGPDLAGQVIRIDVTYVERRLAAVIQNPNLARYIL